MTNIVGHTNMGIYVESCHFPGTDYQIFRYYSAKLLTLSKLRIFYPGHNLRQPFLHVIT